MEDIETLKKVLEELIMNAITVSNDELEGTLSIDLYNDVNLCGADNSSMEDAPLSADDINTLFHFNDPDVSPSVRVSMNDASLGLIEDDSDNGDTTDNGDNNGEELDSSVVAADENYGYSYEAAVDPEALEVIDAFNGYNNIRIPNDADIDDVVSAILDDKESSGLNHAIIEFAQPCIRDEQGVDFEFLVSPGQSLTQDTIIANATINGVTKPIRSIFSSGTVMGNEDNTEFKRLYSEYGADRHIVVEDFEYCGDAPDINTDLIDKATDMFKKHAYIYQLIADNIADSILPGILVNRYTEYRYIRILFMKIVDPRPTGRELFGLYIENVVQPIRDSYNSDIQNLAGEKSIKNCNGNTKKLKNLGNQILDRRNLYAELMIECFEKKRLEIDKSEYDPDYNDCKYLAALTSWSDKDLYKSYLKIGNEEYNNYYLALLSKINVNDENPYSVRYYNLIKGIIENRMALENYSIDLIISEFNTFFKKKVNKKISNAWSRIDKMMQEQEDGGSVSDVVTWISNNHKKDDKFALYTYQQLANIYMFTKKYSPKKVTTSKSASSSLSEKDAVDPMYQLICEEWRMINEFWTEMIAEYRNTTIEECLEFVQEIPNRMQKYHEWPVKSDFLEGYNSYEYYLFENGEVVAEPNEDEDLGSEYDSTEPDIPTAMDPPPDQPIESLLDNPIDPKEPTIKDYAYWVRYFSLATVISLPYLNCGLDIPPVVTMIPLPCIFICVGCVYIKILDIVIVFGISIRGMYIWPIFLFVNVGNTTASILTPLIALLKSLISKISAKINSLAEKPINSIAIGLTNMIEKDSLRLRKNNKQLDVYLSQIKAKKVKNQEKIKNITLKSLNPSANLKLQVVNPILSMYAKDSSTNK